jgi:4-amino-4-deoxy-L-arabinose transferase-like glycosyltransferase
VAGLSYWRFGRFDVYAVNPPLVRLVAALPVIAAGCNEDWSGIDQRPGGRPEFNMGADFAAANGQRSYFLFTIARLACIPFSWIGALACYLWGRDLYGRPAGVMASAIWCFEPNILAHAALITPDVAAAALGMAACYSFWRWLRRPTWTQTILSGLLLGMAELAKTTLILFYPLWPFVWLLYRWPDRGHMHIRDWFREVSMLAVRMLIGIYIINLGYAFEGSFTRLGDFQFVSDAFSGPGVIAPAAVRSLDKLEFETEPADPTAVTNAPPDPVPGNRFAGTGLGRLPVPLPKHYLSGVDLQRKDFEAYSRPSYLRGKYSDHGWWYYYLYAAAIKVPLGLWLLALLALARRRTRILPSPTAAHPVTLGAAPIGWRDEAVLLAPAFVILILVSIHTGFNEHFRYVLPAFPFCFTWLSRNVITDVHTNRAGSATGATGQRRKFARTIAVIGAMVWTATSSLWIFPHSLSYFNELIGGPIHGPAHLLGSNVDWGQDLRYLNWWAQRNLRDETLQIVYHGFFNPAATGFEGVELVYLLDTNPATGGAPQGSTLRGDNPGRNQRERLVRSGIVAGNWHRTTSAPQDWDRISA